MKSMLNPSGKALCEWQTCLQQSPYVLLPRVCSIKSQSHSLPGITVPVGPHHSICSLSAHGLGRVWQVWPGQWGFMLACSRLNSPKATLRAGPSLRKGCPDKRWWGHSTDHLQGREDATKQGNCKDERDWALSSAWGRRGPATIHWISCARFHSHCSCSWQRALLRHKCLAF